MEKELATKAAAHNAAREKLRAQKKEAMKNQSAIPVKQRQKEQELAEAKQDQKEAERQIAAVKARGDDKASIDKQIADWQEAHKHASEMVQASQQALNQQRKQNDDLEVCSSYMTSYMTSQKKIRDPNKMANLFKHSGPFVSKLGRVCAVPQDSRRCSATCRRTTVFCPSVLAPSAPHTVHHG